METVPNKKIPEGKEEAENKKALQSIPSGVLPEQSHKIEQPPKDGGTGDPPSGDSDEKIVVGPAWFRFKKRYFDEGNVGFVTLIFAAIVMAMNGALVCYTSKQAKITQSGIDSSNYYTRQSLGLAQRNARWEFKPYLRIFGRLHMKPLERGKPIVLHMPIKNIGKTPAKNLTLFKNEEIGTGNRPFFPDIVIEDTFGIHPTLQPDEEFELILGVQSLKDEQLEVIQSGRGSIFFFGNVIMDDVFAEKDTFPFCIKRISDTSFSYCRE